MTSMYHVIAAYPGWWVIEDADRFGENPLPVIGWKVSTVAETEPIPITATGVVQGDVFYKPDREHSTVWYPDNPAGRNVAP